MKTLTIAAALAAIALATPAAAEVYGNLGYTGVDAQGVKLQALGGKIGYRFNPYVGAEAEAAFGVGDDDVLGAKVELDNAVAGYVVGFWPVAERTDLFARVGYGNAKITASAGGFSASGDQNGWNAGVGAQQFFTDKDGVRLEYTKWGVEDNGVDADTWSLSYVRKF